MSKLIQPTYSTKQPSTGKTITFRPFTVKEEKALMLTLQEADIETTTIAIKDIIAACTSLDPDKIPYYDVEYIYLQIRSKSIGETIDMIGGCTCDPKVQTDFFIDLTQAELSIDPTTINRMIPVDKYLIEIQHPNISDFALTIKKDAQNANQVVANCIRAIYIGDEKQDWSYDETLEFVESMTTLQQKPIAEFMRQMPTVSLRSKYKCKCGIEHDRKMSGFQNFFL